MTTPLTVAQLAWLRQTVDEVTREDSCGGITLSPDVLRALLRQVCGPLYPMKTAPRDGTEILLYGREHGFVQGVYSPGYWTDSPGYWSSSYEGLREYFGPVWVLGDDLASIEVEEIGGTEDEFHDGSLIGWLPLPLKPPEEA